jgi:hypothetical protein
LLLKNPSTVFPGGQKSQKSQKKGLVFWFTEPDNRAILSGEFYNLIALFKKDPMDPQKSPRKEAFEQSSGESFLNLAEVES